MTYPYYFIEGIPGSGKSTLAAALSRNLPDYRQYREGDISPVELAWCSYMTQDDYADILRRFPALEPEIRAHSVAEDANVITAYTQIHTKDASFYDQMSQFEIYAGRRDVNSFREIVLRRFTTFFAAERTARHGSIFECSLFQNIVEELILFAEYEDAQILAFYQELFACMDQETVCLIRLRPADIAENIRHIKQERVNEQGEEIWYRMMLEYLCNSPYGRHHGFSSFEDLLSHFSRRIRIEDNIIAQLFRCRCLELPSKAFSTEELIASVLEN